MALKTFLCLQRIRMASCCMEYSSNGGMWTRVARGYLRMQNDAEYKCLRVSPRAYRTKAAGQTGTHPNQASVPNVP